MVYSVYLVYSVYSVCSVCSVNLVYSVYSVCSVYSVGKSWNPNLVYSVYLVCSVNLVYSVYSVCSVYSVGNPKNGARQKPCSVYSVGSPENGAKPKPQNPALTIKPCHVDVLDVGVVDRERARGCSGNLRASGIQPTRLAAQSNSAATPSSRAASVSTLSSA